jgi:cation transport ATPase
VGYEELEKKYDEYSGNLKRLQKDLWDKYRIKNQEIVNKANETTQRIEKIEADFQNKMEETKRTTVQTLGVFASLLVLATIALGTFINTQHLDETSFLKIMLSFTLCLSVFVLLLHFVIQQNRKKRLLGISMILFIIMLLAAILFCI